MRTISRIRIANYRHIEALDVAVPKHGLIASGGCERGKTTLLRAIRSALDAQDIGPDAIRTGADRAEILINLDDITVRRVIGPKKSSVSISRGDPKTAGDVIATKQAYLTEMFGTSLFDPLDFFLAKPKERRAKILEVLQVTTTAEELRTYAPDLPADFDDSGHGLEALERARKHYFDRRTEANRAVAEAKKAHAAAEALAKAAPLDDGSDVARAAAASTAADAAVVELRARTRAAAAAAERTKTTRARIASLEEQAAGLDASASWGPTEDADGALTTTKAAYDQAVAEVTALETQLAAARALAAEALSAHEAVVASQKAAAATRAQAEALRVQASELSGAIGAIAEPPSEGEIAAAEQHAAAALAAAASARDVAAGRELTGRAAHALTLLGLHQAKADGLDKSVKALTHDAPAALLAKTPGITGLTIEGDDILLDGVRLDVLSGSTQLDLAVEIARRANAKSKILVVDGLERLDPERMEQFVKRATADDFQLFATRVSSGDLEITAIAADEGDGDGDGEDARDPVEVDDDSDEFPVPAESEAAQ